MQDRQAIKESVRARIDIVELIGRYVRLNQQGNNFSGLCPFHEEKTPSFTVSPEKGVFYCFGCKAGGDVFEFVMRAEKLQFPQALAFLAELAGVELPQAGAPSANLQLRQLNEQVAQHFERNLARKPGERAVTYLKLRGIEAATAKSFRLGYAAPGWHQLGNAFRHQHKGLKALGLTITNAQGRTYDRFRDRLMFPLLDAQGQVAGFAGRKLNDDTQGPKYVNTPTTPLLQKGTLLYGMHLAAEPARHSDTLVLVEGYTDVITAHQHGIRNVTASMGTALTRAQANLCARYAKRIVLAFDQDSAGQKATLRGVRALLDAGLEVRMVRLPAGADPDALIRQQGAAGFEKTLAQAEPFFKVYVELLAGQHDLATAAGKQAVLEDAVPFFQGVGNLYWRDHLVRELAYTLDLPYEEIERVVRSKRFVPSRPLEQTERRWHLGLEEQLLYFLLHGHVSVERATAELAKEDFSRYGELWEAIVGCYQQHGTIQAETLRERVGQAWQTTLNQLYVSELPSGNVAQDVEVVILKLKIARLERHIRSLESDIRQAEADGNSQRAKQLQVAWVEAKQHQAKLRNKHSSQH